MLGHSQFQHYVSSDMVKMKIRRVFRDLPLGSLTFILDDTYWGSELNMDTDSEGNFENIQKNNKPHTYFHASTTVPVTICS